MRAFIYGILWFITLVLVCYYIYSQRQQSVSLAASDSNIEQVEIVNEVEGSKYTIEDSNSNDSDGSDSSNQTNEGDADKNDSSNDNNVELSNNSDNVILDERSESPNKNNNDEAYFDDFIEKAYIEFNPNSSKLPKNDLFDKYLDSIANIMQNEDLKIVLVGHADKTTSRDQQNYDIGLKRAEFIRNLLTAKNVSSGKIQVISEGDSSPRVNGNTSEAKTLNRRVELFIKQKN